MSGVNRSFKASFNLIDQPWIPCVPRGGGAAGAQPVLLGLRDALVRAHEQCALRDDSPLVTVALHRLLLAIVHRVLHGPRTLGEWQALRAQGHFDAARIGAYLESCRSRCDLFDAARPFFQVPYMAGVNTVAAAKLAHEKASGNSITLFDHTTPTTGGLTPAQAARYLVAFQAFAIGGGVSQPFNLSDAALARDYTVLVRGATLFETLLLNLVRYSEETPIIAQQGADMPAWERDQPREPRKDGTVPDGYLDYLTWQSRRVHLIYDGATGLVRECQIRQNLKLPQAPVIFDPFKAYTLSKEGVWFSRRLSMGRAVWRDLPALLEIAEDASTATSRRPAVFDWLAQGVAAGTGRPRGATWQPAFDVHGSLNDGNQATIILWRHDQLPLPLRYLWDRGLRHLLRDGLHLAEEVSGLFKPEYGTGTGNGNESEHAPQGYPRPLLLLAAELLSGGSGRRAELSECKNLVQHFGAERDYWSRLELRFRAVMLRLAAEAEVAEAGAEVAEAGAGAGAAGASASEAAAAAVLRQWMEDVARCARATFGGVVGSLDTSGRTLRARVLAERAFNWQLREALTAFGERSGSGEAGPEQGHAAAEAEPRGGRAGGRGGVGMTAERETSNAGTSNAGTSNAGKDKATQSGTWDEPRERAFVQMLRRLSGMRCGSEGAATHVEQNLGALAALRRGLGRAPGTAAEMYPYVVPYLPRDLGPEEEAAYFLIAALFAWHPKDWTPGERGRSVETNFGASLRWLAGMLGASDGVERRFVALLDADREDVSEQLRHLVGLLKSTGIPVDWTQLLRDVLHWEHPQRVVQRGWARSYWRGFAPASAPPLPAAAQSDTPAAS